MQGVISINGFKKYLPWILILSLLVNFYFITVFYQSLKFDKSQTSLSISTYTEHLRTFTGYVDLLLDKPDDAQLLSVLMDQSNEMKAVLSSRNYHSFRHMGELYSSLNSITKQVSDMAYNCKIGIDSEAEIEDFEYINNNLKDIVHFFDEIKSDIFSDKLENDYLVDNQAEVSNKLNQKIELNDARLLKYAN